jgi:crossover junction endodeoxyribonuclease RuvC
VRILGIDPGYSTLGWAIIEGALEIVEYGIISTNSDLDIDERLLTIHYEINKIIKIYSPDYLAIEQLFFAKNTKTAIDVAKCIGVILLTARLNNITYNEYSPSQIKSAVTGYGRASKEQIQNIVMKIYNLRVLPRPDDVADALAVAACHFLNIKKNKI